MPPHHALFRQRQLSIADSSLFAVAGGGLDRGRREPFKLCKD